MTATIQKINSPPEAMRIVVETSLQTTNVSFNRRLSQYLHRSPILSNGCVAIADYSYTVVSYDSLWFSVRNSLIHRSLPSSPVITCLHETNIMIKQNQSSDTINSSNLLKPISTTLPPIHCPFPGLSDCYRTLITSILYYRMFQKEIEEGSVRLFKGILVTGDHGLGKTAVVGNDEEWGMRNEEW